MVYNVFYQIMLCFALLCVSFWFFVYGICMCVCVCVYVIYMFVLE